MACLSLTIHTYINHNELILDHHSLNFIKNKTFMGTNLLTQLPKRARLKPIQIYNEKVMN